MPPEARDTLALIKAGGPYRYPQDGKTFHNREKVLPKRERGYYREFTVKTPGRAIAERAHRRRRGGEFYYTEDHYRFRRIIE